MRQHPVSLSCGGPWCGSAQVGRRTPRVGSIAACYSCFCPEPRSERQRLPRIRHGAKHLRRGRFGSSAPRSSASGAGFARDPQRTTGCLGSTAQEHQEHAGPNHSGNPRRRLPFAGPEVSASAAEPSNAASYVAKESCFFGVKVFSYENSPFEPRMSRVEGAYRTIVTSL